MKIKIKIISQVMTPVPMVIDAQIPITKALGVMSKAKVRHLPVVEGKRVVGLLSERDAKEAALSKWGADFLVKDVMHSDPYVVRPDTSLEKVLTQMMKNKYGSTVVQEKGGEVTGIFTTVDALYLLRRILKPTRLKVALKTKKMTDLVEIAAN